MTPTILLFQFQLVKFRINIQGIPKMVNFSLILCAKLQQFITKSVSGVQLQDSAGSSHLIDEYLWHELGGAELTCPTGNLMLVVLILEHQVTSQAHLTAWCQGRGENDPPRCQNSIPAGRSWSRDTLWLLYSHMTCEWSRSHSFPLNIKPDVPEC